MKRQSTYQHSRVLPADIILNLINDNPENDLDILHYYNGYIHAAAEETAYTADGIKKGTFVNEDLLQEIRFEVLHCLPVLRKKLIEILLSTTRVIILIDKDTHKIR